MDRQKSPVKPAKPEEQPQDFAEATPNPHNEATIVEMPVRTNQQERTESQNVAQTASTRDGQIHPSVNEPLAGGVADTDSMFNNADPQVADIKSSGVRNKGTKKRKSA